MGAASLVELVTLVGRARPIIRGPARDEHARALCVGDLALVNASVGALRDQVQAAALGLDHAQLDGAATARLCFEPALDHEANVIGGANEHDLAVTSFRLGVAREGEQAEGDSKR